MTRYFTDRRDSWVIALDGDVVSGETYKAKDVIKGMLGGRWDADRKVWIVNLSKLDAATKSSTGLYDASEAQISTLTPAAASSNPRRNSVYTHGSYIAVDGVEVCCRCHTACYGDCTAN